MVACYLENMCRPGTRHICSVVLVLAFTVGSALYGVQKGAMASQMVLAASVDCEVCADCRGCGDKEVMFGAACAALCASMMATLPDKPFAVFSPLPRFNLTADAARTGIPVGPDHSPP